MNISEEWSHLNNLDDDRLYEMAMELRPDIHSIEVLGEKICEHIIKYRLYEFDRPSDLNHWLTEITGWLVDINQVDLKLKSKHRFNSKEYEDYIFGYFGDSLNDCMVALSVFKAKYVSTASNPYPDFDESDTNTGKELMLIIAKLKDAICSKLSNNSYGQYDSSLSNCKNDRERIFQKILADIKRPITDPYDLN